MMTEDFGENAVGEIDFSCQWMGIQMIIEVTQCQGGKSFNFAAFWSTSSPKLSYNNLNTTLSETNLVIHNKNEDH